MQIVAPRKGLNVPEEHSNAALAPVEFTKAPSGAGLQKEEPFAAEKFPTGQRIAETEPLIDT